jgi:hypothetical protein
VAPTYKEERASIACFGAGTARVGSALVGGGFAWLVSAHGVEVVGAAWCVLLLAAVVVCGTCHV